MPSERDTLQVSGGPGDDEIIAGIAKILWYWEDSDLLYTETAVEIFSYCLSGKSLEEIFRNLERKRQEVL
jgi:hypothetical protein